LERRAEEMKKVQLITDGSCIGNPGPGGWACILQDGSDERELSGSEAQTTNNRMELTAAINGLRALGESCEVELVTDSQYLRQGITEYLPRWKTNGWCTSNRKPVQNQDLWRELDDLASRHIVHWTWVAGHCDHDLQNRCDALAAAAARRQAGHSVKCSVQSSVP
jgi:ribonuclease HI